MDAAPVVLARVVPSAVLAAAQAPGSRAPILHERADTLDHPVTGRRVWSVADQRDGRVVKFSLTDSHPVLEIRTDERPDPIEVRHLPTHR